MNPAGRIRIRWRIFGFMFGFGFIAYLQQKSITVAAAPMMPELGLTQLQIGWLEQGFAVGYAVFQIPIGIFAERWGARGTLVLMGLAAVTPQELAEIGNHGVPKASHSITARQVVRLLGNRNVLLLTLSYMTMNYVFYLISNWAFLYLIQERHFSVLEGGWLAAIPPLGAAFGAGIGGVLTGIACRRYGPLKGFRSVPLLALPAAGLLLLLIVGAVNAYVAVAGLALCFGLVELTEGAFWGAAMTVGRSDTMVVTSIMNTGGTMGGIIGIPIVAYLSGHDHLHTAFFIGAALAMVSASARVAIDLRNASADPDDTRALNPASAVVTAV